MRLRQQYLTRNDCYRAGREIVPRGVMVHSTGANNPNVSRYVPGDEVLGWNRSGNHWDRPGVEKCVHAFIGRWADGEVGVVQTLPWTCRGWHCGAGKAGSANNTHISFEMCEDDLTDEKYFQAVFAQAAQLIAHLCRQYGLDPLADGVVLSHREGAERGLASNHADPEHWLKRFGRTMEDLRRAAAQHKKGEEQVTQEVFDTMLEDWLRRQGEKQADPWAEEVMARARDRAITDGSRPQSFATRQEVAAMICAADK